jgi:predicted transcriptional regulator
MKELTKAEEQIMQYLWKVKKGFINDLLNEFPSPKPAYNTVSTIIRILEKKGFVGHTAFGKTHEYYPLVTKKEYTKGYFGSFMKNYFADSYTALASFLTKEKNMSISDLEEIKNLMEAEIQKQKSGNHE